MKHCYQKRTSHIRSKTAKLEFFKCKTCNVFLLSNTAVERHKKVHCLQIKRKGSGQPIVEKVRFPRLSIAIHRIHHSNNVSRMELRDASPTANRRIAKPDSSINRPLNCDKSEAKCPRRRRGRIGGLVEVMKNLGVESLDAVVNATSTPRKSRIAAKEKLRSIYTELDDNDVATNNPPKKSIKIRRGRPSKKGQGLDEDNVYEPMEKDASSSEDDVPAISRNKQATLLVDSLYIHNCTKCTAKFWSPKELTKHQRVHESGKEKFTCPVCGKAFGVRSHFRVHINRHVHSEAIEKTMNLWEKWPSFMGGNKFTGFQHQFSCKFCLIRHPNHNSFLFHMKEQHPDRTKDSNFSCPYSCDVISDSIHALVKHIKEKHKDKYFRTKISDSVWGVGPEKCNICQKNINPYRKAEHKKRHEKAEKSKFYCAICFSGFKDRFSLRRHFIIHLQKNPFVCALPGCGMKFQDVPHLYRHRLTHTAQVLTCSKCDITYRENPRKKHQCVYDESKIVVGKDGKKYLKRTILLRTTMATSGVTDNGDDDIEKIMEEEQNAINAVKMENEDCVQRFELESVHYVDKIIKTEDGAIHVKGEQLNPVDSATSNNPVTNFSQVEDVQSTSDIPNIDETLWEIDPLKLIVEDPVYQELIKAKPEYAKVMESKGKKPGGGPRDLRIRCEHCGDCFNRYALLAMHKRKCRVANDQKETNEAKSTAISATIMCTLCGYKTSSQSDLNNHVKSAPNHGKACKSQYHRCPYTKCGVVLNSAARLEEHIKLIHCTEKKFKCDYETCGKLFATKMRLKTHVKLRHVLSAEAIKTARERGETVTFKCSKCCEEFQDGSLFVKHQQRHYYKEKVAQRAKCQICGDECATRHTLKRHIMLVHTQPHKEKSSEEIQAGESKSNDTSMILGI